MQGVGVDVFELGAFAKEGSQQFELCDQVQEGVVDPRVHHGSNAGRTRSSKHKIKLKKLSRLSVVAAVSVSVSRQKQRGGSTASERPRAAGAAVKA